MARTIKAATLLALAKQVGFNGNETDFEAQKKALIESKKTFKDSSGNDIDIKALVVEQPADNQVVVTEVTDQPAAPEGDGMAKSVNPTNDLNTLIKSAVADAVKGFGVDRPKLGLAGDVSVTPMDEVMYDDAVKRGDKTRSFKNGHTARRFLDQFTVNVLGKTPQYFGNPKVEEARKRLAAGAVNKAYTSATNAGGGALVFGEFQADLINNVNQYGVARQLADVKTMNSDSLTLPKKEGIHTVYYPQQAVAGTQSTGVSYSNVTLNAKTGIVLVQLSRQLLDDGQLSAADDAMKECARAIAFTEDKGLFTANNEAGYPFVGIITKLAAIGYGTAASLVVGGGDWSAHTFAHMTSVLGKVPQYARQNMKATCSPEFLGTLAKIGGSQGGVTWRETLDNGLVPYFMGIPIVLNNIMNSTSSTGTNTVDFIVGDFSKCAVLGDRVGIEMEADTSVGFTSYSVYIRAVIRHDIAVHDVGTSSVAGPIVALYQS